MACTMDGLLPVTNRLGTSSLLFSSSDYLGKNIRGLNQRTALGESVPEPESKIKNKDLFHGKQVVLDLTSEENKVKTSLKKKILENGGEIFYVVTKDTSWLLYGKKEPSQVKLNTANRYGIPVVFFEYINECLEQETLLPLEPYLIDNRSKLEAFREGKIAFSKSNTASANAKKFVLLELNSIDESVLESYQIVKYALLKGRPKYSSVKKTDYYKFATLELHVKKTKDEPETFCVFVHEGELYEGNDIEINAQTSGQFVSTAKEALSVYCTLYQKLTSAPLFLQRHTMPIHSQIGSTAFQTLHKSLLFSVESVDPNILTIVSNCWEESKRFLSQCLENFDEYIQEWKAREAQNILIQIVVALSKNNENLAKRLGKEFYKVISFKPEHAVIQNLITPQGITGMFQICNLLINIASLLDNSPYSMSHRVFSLYSGLNCQISYVEPSSAQFKEVEDQLLCSQTCDVGLTVHKIFNVKRNLEATNFASNLGNERKLFHGTLPMNILGILGNGLLPVISTITNVFGRPNLEECALGFGIYFSDSINSCLKFSPASSTGTRYVFISKVALGKMYETRDVEPSLLSPPSGYDSVLGVKSLDERDSFFHENEYVIYKENQQELCYLVEFSLKTESINLPGDEASDLLIKRLLQNTTKGILEEHSYQLEETYGIKDEIKPPVSCLKRVGLFLPVEESEFPLESTHIRANVVDLVAKITVFQTYRNDSETLCEIQYTFPLSGGAAVCGFEAFIGNKHVVGEVKEKELAHEEYREAVSQGHGAYLLDEEKPNVFTARLGNLPAKTRAIIKITYIVELSVEKDSLQLSIPGSISPEVSSSVEALSFGASIQMATNIQTVNSPTHPIQVKQTDTKAVVKLLEDCKWGNGLIISIRMREMHIPRMWVEKHPEKGTEVCMVTYYPEFECPIDSKRTEIILLLDASNSMRGESFQTGLTLIVMCLKNFNENVRFNVVVFGSVFGELFPESQEFNDRTKSQAIDFLRKIQPKMGINSVMPPLKSCDLLTKFEKTNVFLITDGYFHSENQLYNYVSNLEHVRLFCLAVGEKSNRHFLKRSSYFSGGSFEEYISGEKNKWESKIKDQILKSNQLSLTDIVIEWQQFDEGDSQIVVAPQKIKSLFSGGFLIAYSFVSNCSVATLKAKIGNREYQTVVSAHKLNELSGTLVHTLAAKARIDDWEAGILEDAGVLQTAMKEDLKESIVEIAKVFNLVSSLTSFIAVEKRSEQEQISEEPRLESLLEESNVDILPYIAFSPTNDHIPKPPDCESSEDPNNADRSSGLDSLDFPTLQMEEIEEQVMYRSRSCKSKKKIKKSIKDSLPEPVSMKGKRVFIDRAEIASLGVPTNVEMDSSHFFCSSKLNEIEEPKIFSKRSSQPKKRVMNVIAASVNEPICMKQNLVFSEKSIDSMIDQSSQADGIFAFGSLRAESSDLNLLCALPKMNSSEDTHVVFQSEECLLEECSFTDTVRLRSRALPPGRAPLRSSSCAMAFIEKPISHHEVAIERSVADLHRDASQCMDMIETDYRINAKSSSREKLSEKVRFSCSASNFVSDNLDEFSEEMGCGLFDSCSFDADTDVYDQIFGFAHDLMFGVSSPIELRCTESVTIVPVLRNFLSSATKKVVSEDSKMETTNFFSDTFARFGGGTPICGMMLKELRALFQKHYDVDILIPREDGSHYCALLNFFDEASRDGVELPVDDIFLQKFQESLFKFIQKMERAGLKSMGSSIYSGVCELACLVYIVYYYFLKYLVPVVFDKESLDEPNNPEEIVKHIIEFLSSSAESDRWELVILGSCMVRIHFLDKKYPLLYSTLEMGSSWENAIFNEIQKLL